MNYIKMDDNFLTRKDIEYTASRLFTMLEENMYAIMYDKNNGGSNFSVMRVFPKATSKGVLIYVTFPEYIHDVHVWIAMHGVTQSYVITPDDFESMQLYCLQLKNAL
jgi:hypothetical protein